MKRTRIRLFVTAMMFSLAIADGRGDQLRVVVQQAVVRLRPDPASPVVATVGLGTLLDLRSRDGDWYLVELPAKEAGLRLSGYIQTSDVEGVAGITLPPTEANGQSSLARSAQAERVLVLDAVSRTVGAADITGGSVDLVSYGREVMPRRGPLDFGPPSGVVVNRGRLEDRGTPTEMVVSPDGSKIIVIDHGPGAISGRYGWRSSRRSELVVVDVRSHQQIASVQGVWGMPVIHHVSEDGVRLTAFGPGYRSNDADEPRPAELVSVDLRTGDTIGRFDLGQLLGTTQTAEQWAEVTALSPDGEFLYVVDRGSPSNDRTKHVNGRVIVVSTTTGRILPPLPLGSEPRQLVIDAAGGQALVLSDHPPYVKDREQQNGELHVIRGASIAATIPVAPDPQFVRIAPDRDYFYVFSPEALTSVDAVAMRDAGSMRIRRQGAGGDTVLGETSIKRMDGRSSLVIQRVVYGANRGTVSDAVISPDGSRGYVLHAGSSAVSIIDLQQSRRIKTITTGRSSKKIVKELQAVLASSVSEIGARQAAIASGRDWYFSTTYFLAPPETELAVGPDGRFAYVLNSGSDDVTVIDTEAGRVIRHIAKGGTSLQVMPGGNFLAVGNEKAVRFIDMRTHAERKDLAVRGPHIATTVSPDGSRLWVLSHRNVSTIDTRTGKLVARFKQFEAPTQILFRGGVGGPADALRIARASQTESLTGAERTAVSATGATAALVPESGSWVVWHMHGTGSMCAGSLYLKGGRIGFRSGEVRHSWEAPLSTVDEIESNRMFQGGGRVGSFHVKLGTGENYNFSSAEFPPDRLAPTLKTILARSRGAK